MIPDVLGGLLWLARLGLRSRPSTVLAGHGYADPGFRPSTLPFVSLVGPLNIEVEPERDPPVPSDVLIQLPGHLIGAPRTSESVTAGTTLSATFDDDASATITLAAGDFSTPAQAQSVCSDIENAFRAAAAANAFVDADNAQITDEERVSELAQITCRWDVARSAIALSSGRHGYLDQLSESSVAVDGGTAVEALGLGAPLHQEAGRHARQRAPAPKGFGIEVRFDLWGSTQRDLAYLIEALIRTVPTRTRMVLRPALLAGDLATGDTELQLLGAGEPTLTHSLVHLEATDGFHDRVSGEVMATTAGASVDSDPPRIRLSGQGTARRVLVTQPSVPDPRRPERLAPQGAALTLDLALEGGAAGDSGRIISLATENSRLLRLDFTILTVDATLMVDLIASAEFEQTDGTFSVASTTRRVALERLSPGAVSIHLIALAATGAVAIDLDGLGQNLNDPLETPIPPTAAPGIPAGGDGLEIVIGNPDGNPIPFTLGLVHALASPLPALDPHLRRSTTAATQFQPGDHIMLGETSNGWVPAGETEGFFVRSVAGDRIRLDRPVSRDWRRGRTLVHSRDCFVHQKYVKRRDDLMNRVYRYCVGYRVSALLEHPETAIAGGLVAEPVVELQPRNHPRRVGARAPGPSAVDTESSPIPHLNQE